MDSRTGLKRCIYGDSIHPVASSYTRLRQPTARVPSVARGTIFNVTLSELKYINYDIIKKLNFQFNRSI
jgi:hypothetical protein